MYPNYITNFLCPSWSNSLSLLFSQLQSLTSSKRIEGCAIPPSFAHTQTHTDTRRVYRGWHFSQRKASKWQVSGAVSLYRGARRQAGSRTHAQSPTVGVRCVWKEQSLTDTHIILVVRKTCSSNTQPYTQQTHTLHVTQTHHKCLSNEKPSQGTL